MLHTTRVRPQTEQPSKWLSSPFSRQQTQSHRCCQLGCGKARVRLDPSFQLLVLDSVFLTTLPPAQCLAHSYSPTNTRRSKAARGPAHSLHTLQLLSAWRFGCLVGSPLLFLHRGGSSPQGNPESRVRPAQLQGELEEQGRGCLTRSQRETSGRGQHQAIVH